MYDGVGLIGRGGCRLFMLCGWVSQLLIWELVFIKADMARGVDSVCCWVQAQISTLRQGVSHEYAGS